MASSSTTSSSLTFTFSTAPRYAMPITTSSCETKALLTAWSLVSSCRADTGRGLGQKGLVAPVVGGTSRADRSLPGH
eukprot:663879-Hanusia_phi.AAC.1